VIYNVTPLSGPETGLLATWERERRSRVTIRELRQLLGSETRSVVSSLLEKGLLERIAPGLFLIHPFRSLSRPRAVSAPVVAAALLADEPYYLGGWWAFSVHRLSQQVYGSILDAYAIREHRPRRLRTARLVFHVLPRAAFEYGIETITVEGTDVCVSDAERTILDALDYPKTFGGVRAALQLVGPALDRVDRRRLVIYAARGSHPSTCQRLGVLLERRGASARSLAPLARRIRETASLLSMLPDAPRTGPVNRRWRVVENDDRDAKNPVGNSAETSQAP
jgi:predicted transcriptional regulator of viral defense system